MKEYKAPDLELIRFNAEDILAVSNPPPVGDSETPVIIFPS